MVRYLVVNGDYQVPGPWSATPLLSSEGEIQMEWRICLDSDVVGVVSHEIK